MYTVVHLRIGSTVAEIMFIGMPAMWLGSCACAMPDTNSSLLTYFILLSQGHHHATRRDGRMLFAQHLQQALSACLL